MIILGLAGYAASGKSEASRYLNTKYGFTIFEFSKEVEEEALKLGFLENEVSIEEKKRRLSEVGKMIRDRYKNDEIFAMRIIEKIRNSKADKCVVVGFRSLKEVDVFRKTFGKGFYLIFIIADAKLRYERRKKEDKKFNLSFEEFLERDTNDIKILKLNELEKVADIVIENNSSLDDFYRKIDLVVNSLI